MREKIVEYNNNEYKITFGPDRFGIDELKIYKRSNLLCFRYWDEISGWWWINRDPNENPVETAMEVIKEKENKIIEKTEREKKLDEWFK
jgi:hypothetical protein